MTKRSHVSCCARVSQCAAPPGRVRAHRSLDVTRVALGPSLSLSLSLAGANVDARTREGKTPLHLASCYGKVACAHTLLEAGANLHACDHDGRDAVAVAGANSGTGSAAMLELLQPRCEASSLDMLSFVTGNDQSILRARQERMRHLREVQLTLSTT